MPSLTVIFHHPKNSFAKLFFNLFAFEHGATFPQNRFLVGDEYNWLHYIICMSLHTREIGLEVKAYMVCVDC